MKEAFRKWKEAPTPENMGELLTAARPVLERAAASYAGNAAPVMHSQAKKLAIKAFNAYDPSKGTKLQSYLYTQLQPLRRAATQRTSAVKIPERTAVDLAKLHSVEEEFKQTKYRDPTDTELADATGLSLIRISRIRAQSKMAVPESAFRDEEGNIRQPAVKTTDPEDVWIEYVWYDLDAIDKKILEWRTGLHGKKIIPNTLIARRLKLTPAAISQRAAKIAAKLEEGKELGRAW